MSDQLRYAGPPDPPYTTFDPAVDASTPTFGGVSGLPVDPSWAQTDGDVSPVEEPADELIVAGGDSPVELAGPDTDETPRTGFATRTELHRMSRADLDEYAAKHGISTEGNKDEVHQRVVDAGKFEDPHAE